MAKTLFIEDELISMLVYKLKLHWVDGEDICNPHLAYEDGTMFAVDEYEYVDIPLTKIQFENGEHMECDGILFFGDGCMEFHDTNDCDAYHWDRFTDESVLKIEEVLSEMVNLA